MDTEKKALLYALLTILAWSTVSTAFKVSLEHMSPMQLIFISMTSASIFLTGVLIYTKEIKHLCEYTFMQWIKIASLGLIIYAYYVFLFLGYDRLPAQIAQPINNTWAIVLTLFSFVFLKQKLSLKEFIFILFAYAGVVIIAVGGQSVQGSLSAMGLLCIIISTLLYPLYWLANNLFKLPSVSGLWGSFTIAALLALISILFNSEGLPKSGIPAGIYVGLFELGIPFILWGQALKLTKKISRIAPLTFLVPFLSLFWVSFIIKEEIASSTIVGLCFIVLGTFLQQKEATKNAPVASSDEQNNQ